MLNHTEMSGANTSKSTLKAGSHTVLKDGSIAKSANSSVIPATHIPSALFRVSKPTDVEVIAASMYLLPLTTRVPLKFGSETVTEITCVRVCLTARDLTGQKAVGWGETPLSVQWAWPSENGYRSRLASMVAFCQRLTHDWPQFTVSGHPMELGYDFIRDRLPVLLAEHNSQQGGAQMPYLAALICVSAFDIALHDAYGNLHKVDIYKTYNRQYMNRNLADFLTSDEDASVSFQSQYPEDYLISNPPQQLDAWHLVGGLDPVTPEDLSSQEMSDGHPVMLTDWIVRDGLKCLKVKLRGDDAQWDYNRLVQVGKCSIETGVESLSSDFNCCVLKPDYVNAILDRLRTEHPVISDMLLYVEQPFPYELEEYPIDVHSISDRTPLFLDESAHDWQQVQLGYKLGWSGVALKTCKTQTGAILSMCWAKAHGMSLMVQDLTNPMLAMIPHVRLAAHTGTIRGVETNAMQFYPAVSATEAEVHPGLYTRRNGKIDLSTLSGPGFGYQVDEIGRSLPEPIDTFSRESTDTF